MANEISSLKLGSGSTEYMLAPKKAFATGMDASSITQRYPLIVGDDYGIDQINKIKYVDLGYIKPTDNSNLEGLYMRGDHVLCIEKGGINFYNIDGEALGTNINWYRTNSDKSYDNSARADHASINVDFDSLVADNGPSMSVKTGAFSVDATDNVYINSAKHGIQFGSYNISISASNTNGSSGYITFSSTRLDGGGNTTEYSELLMTRDSFYPSADCTEDYDIGTSSHRFCNGYFSGSVYAAEGFYEESDERLKNFANPIDIDLDKLAALRKAYFTWKKDGDDAKLNIGVSAQEVQSLFPEVVTELEDGYLNVDYTKLSVVALAAIDKLHENQKALEDRIAKLESLVDALINQ
jgi:hypothetical protein